MGLSSLHQLLTVPADAGTRQETPLTINDYENPPTYDTSPTSKPMSDPIPKTPKAPYVPNGVSKIPNNAIFNTLTQSNVIENANNVRSAGVDVTNDEMGRVSRVFNYDVILFMLFIQLDGGGEGDTRGGKEFVDVEEAVMDVDTIIKVI